jgi:hypothetical protein
MRKPAFLFIAMLIMSKSFSQDDDMLKGLDSSNKIQYVESAFKSPRVIMSHSIQMLKPGVLDFRILHRFGPVNGGFNEFFGLDQARMRIGLDYGLTRNLTVGAGRSTFLKEADAFLKYRFLQQSTGERSAPVSLVVAGGSTIRLGRNIDSVMKAGTTRRMGYYGQLLVGRKFSDAFTFQFSPIIVHQNLVPLISDANDVYALGTGARVKLTKHVSLNADYYYIFNPLQGRRNPLSIGFDLETGGHVFQLHFSNSEGMNERSFINETTNDWGNGGIRFGFNLSRVFQVKKVNTE